jgi:hypothetical protein
MAMITGERQKLPGIEFLSEFKILSGQAQMVIEHRRRNYGHAKGNQRHP